MRHFEKDYGAHIAGLMSKYPIKEAMSLAVGGQFELFGKIQVALLTQLGLANGQTVIDLGCGSKENCGSEGPGRINRVTDYSACDWADSRQFVSAC